MKKYCKPMKAFCIVCLILVLVSCSAANSFENSVVSGNYANAITIYNNKILGNSSKESEAKNFLLKYMQDTSSNFASGQIDETTAGNAFDCLLKIEDELDILNVELTHTLDHFTALQTSKENYKAAVEALETSDYEKAMPLFAEVNEADTENFTLAQEQLETARDEYKMERMIKLQTALEASEYDNVISLGTEAINLLGNDDQDLQNLIDLAVYQKTYALIDGYIKSENISSAIQTYQSFIDLHADLVTTELSEKMSVCEENFVKRIIESSKEVYFQRGAEEAVKEIEKGRSVLENEKFDALYELFLSALAEPWEHITNCIPESGVWTNTTNAYDFYGNIYQGDLIGFNKFWMKKYTSFELVPNKKFTNFTAIMFPDASFPSSENARLKIFGDSILIYDSGNITQRTKSVNIDIDIANVEVLEIRLTDKIGESTVWLQDAKFYKKLTEDEIEMAIQLL